MEKYIFLNQLGVGTFGRVNLYKNTETGKHAVIKEIFSTSEQVTQNEVYILASLNHPNIIQYFDSFVLENKLHIVMEYALQGNLHDYIKRQDKLLTQKYVLFIFTQIVMAISYIHQNNIIHRDLKAENVMLTGSTGNIIKIADFGISKVLYWSNGEQTQTQIGTTNYLAPEICIGLPYGKKADIWALGCILYELCALRRMFDGPVANIIMNITSGEIPKIEVNQYDVSLQKLIDKMCQYDPDDRPTVILVLRDPLVLRQMLSIQVNLGRYDPE